MTDPKAPFWSAQDEAEYIRQEQQRVKAMKDAAFTTGFDAGAAWGLSRGMQEIARIFEKTAAVQNEFPPELVKSFAASMIELAPKMEKTIITGMKKTRAEGCPGKVRKRNRHAGL